MRLGSKLGLVAGCCALAIAVPAAAKPGPPAKPDKHNHPGKSHKCAVRKVAYRASGKLISFAATKNSDGTYSGMVTVHVTNTNHHAAADKGKDVTYTLVNAKVTFGSGANPPAAGDKVTVIGKITAVGKKCTNQGDAGKLTVRKVNITKADKGKKK
jgi:hypothetical protein